MSELLSSEFRKVKKKRNGELHQCCQCFREIPFGTEVEVQVCVGDGCIYTVMTCNPCLTYIDDVDLWQLYKHEEEMPEGAVLEDMRYNGNEEEFFWIKVKYFGYGGEKWDQ